MKLKRIIKAIQEVIDTATLKNTDQTLFTDKKRAELWADSWIKEPLEEVLKELER